MVDDFCLRSHISTQLMTETLKRGFLLSLIGILGLIYASVFLDVTALKTWGWIIYLVSLGLITVGMLPYRKLTRLQVNPRELRLTSEGEVLYLSKGQKLLMLPLKSIDQLEYIENGNHYGIAVRFKSPLPQPVVVHQQSKEVAALRKLGQAIAQAPLYFPYFSKHAYQELKDWIHEDESKQK